ncbi:MAG: carbohydrate-binding protein [Hamadaea sp.]|uniref:rhamnogalacturonan lyase family protein n=1 Tax=Hamadaea sp. TaxID=2024425 RepID=UPI00179D4D0B|nr:CBM35 domain-containing protein [Hamadaea sp.]NUR72434.1 carbohydrate-binding protein [Hamadaea sp.]NUT19959.1 carbohydrate-binding protein [Hamadaea sp.]
MKSPSSSAARYLSRHRFVALSASAVTVGALLTAGGPAAAAVTRYEAENSPATCDGTIDNNWAGYSGGGFCNGTNAVGAAAQFTLTAAASGTFTITIGYANGTTTGRPADIVVNGSVAQSASAFDPTGAWSTWATKTVSVSLAAGSNTIRLSPTTAAGLANIDYLDADTGGGGGTSGRQMEDLDRGLISVRSGSGNLVSWRLLGTESSSVTFNLYRGGTRIYSGALTNYLDAGAAADASYTVRAVVNGAEQAASAASLAFANGYRDVRLQIPAGGTTPDGVAYTYSANDVSVGDLDGDGVLEFVVKWDPSNAKDNSQSGYTGNVYVDAYKLDGTRLWRIDLGRNIRAGAHYTQFQVYDLDGDGRAEVAMKTADGTVSGTGQVIGSSSADYRNSSGYVLSGPEYLTVFNGTNGSILATANYIVPRGTVSSWGDSYGNRVDRFLAGIAYLDGQRPSLIMARGYYTRTVIAAWDFRNGALTSRWTFDSNVSGSTWTGRGNHQLSIADVDGDGRDEVLYGSMAVDDNGTGLWTNGTHHGDAYHVGDLIPSRPGLEVFKPSETTSEVAAWMADARTGQIIWSNPTCGCDNGRAVADDVWAGSPGAEAWSAAVDGLRNGATGANIGRKPGSINFLVWWDGDPVRELLDSTHIDKYGTSSDTRLLTGSNVASNNGTKSTPAISGDLFGDWREEVVWRTSDSSALRIYSTPTPTDRRLYTLLHDPQYRVALAWQNTAYNQPPHPSYFIGDGMSTPPQPTIYVR